MVWLARVTFRFPPPDTWGDPTTVEWRQNKENAKEVPRFKREMIRHEVDKVWLVMQPFTSSTFYGEKFPPQWSDQRAENHERVRWFK
jgi:hypothetical protein